MVRSLILVVALAVALPALAATPRELSAVDAALTRSALGGRRPLTASVEGRFLTVWLQLLDSPGYPIYARVSGPDGKPVNDRAHMIVPFSAGANALIAKDSTYAMFWRGGSRDRITEIASDGRVLRTVEIPLRFHSRGSAAWARGRYLVISDSAYLLDENGQLLREMSDLGFGPLDSINRPVDVRVVAAQDHFYVARLTRDNRLTIHKLRLDGEPVQQQPIAVRAEPVEDFSFATNGQSLLLANVNRLESRFEILSLNLEPLASHVLPGSFSNGEACVWTGSRYVVFSDSVPGWSATAISRDTALPIALNDVVGSSMGVASNGSTVLFAVNPTSILGHRFAASTLEDTGRDILSMTPTMQDAPHLASDGTNYLAAWYEHNVGLRFTMLDRQGIPLAAPATISAANRGHALTFGGDHYLVVWSHPEGLFGIRINRAGLAIDGFPFPIRLSQAIQGRPAVVWTGRHSVVMWVEAGTPFSAVVTPFAEVREPKQIAPPYAGWSMDAASDGSSIVVVFPVLVQQSGFPCFIPNCPPRNAVAVARLHTDGAPVGIPYRLPGLMALNDSLAVASDGSRFLVVHSSYNGDVIATPVDARSPGLEVQEPTVLFRWVSASEVDVAGSPDGFDVAFHYGFHPYSNFGSHLAIRHLSSSGLPGELVGEPVHVRQPSALGRLADGEDGRHLIPFSAANFIDAMPRAVTYRTEELVPRLFVPRAPFTTSATRPTRCEERITWVDMSDDEVGFFIEAQIEDGWEPVRSVPADITKLEGPCIRSDATAVRVRAIGSGGLSDGNAVAFPPVRRRVAGR
jgi:hypothetical protein